MTNEGISPLRRRMIEDMSVRNLSPTTRASYIHNMKKFSQYFGRSPDCLGLEEVRAYQVHLEIKKSISSLPRCNRVVPVSVKGVADEFDRG